MRSRLGSVLSTVVIIAVGLITLVGLLVGPELGQLWFYVNDIGRIPLFASLFVQVAVIVVTLTIILGLVNLMVVHITRLRRGEGRVLNRLNSGVLLATFILTLAVYFVERVTSTPSQQTISRVLLDNVLVAIESALAALLFFSLVYGASRILRTEVSFSRVLFIAMVVLVLVAALPLPGLGIVTQLYNWMLLVPVNAGARGLLIGIGLATALTGLRILFGQDKTYH
jgi:hypothetical protein